MGQEQSRATFELKTVYATKPNAPPDWALWERFLIDATNQAAVEFVERYTRPDGTLIWRDKWPGMDGSDDGYESFVSFPLFYALGGSETVHGLAREEWNAITWQFTQYGQIYREFDAYYDWMHHGESYTYIYYFGLADPTVHQDFVRAIKFAALYIGEDEEAANWDSEHKLIRSPINGSKGPRFEMTAEDWVTHRPVLANYLAPFEDIPNVPGLDTDPFAKADWNDDAVFAEILKLMNQRMAKGDVPLNLTATSLVTNAYLYTGEEKYRRWVLDYVEAWQERTRANGGITPDNIGLSGKIGEYMDGKWWGGYYGWRWPHGAMNILESTLIAASNALLLTGDFSYLDLPRSQLDLLWSLGREIDGVFKIPHRHGDRGWFDYRPPDPRLWVHLWFLSQSEEDLKRLENFPDKQGWAEKFRLFGKGGQYHPAGWFLFVTGRHPNYPDIVLRDHWTEMFRRLERMRNDDLSKCKEWDVHHWQDINPVLCDALVQLTTGSPQVIYHGGLLHCRVRYFDPEKRRPGLPDAVAALVEGMGHDHITLQLVNLDPLRPREVILQAGAFGEHRFTTVQKVDDPSVQEPPIEIEAKSFQVHLEPSAGVKLSIGMKRFVNHPSYAFPWHEG